MTKNDVFRDQNIPQNSKVDPRYFFPALSQLPRQLKDQNEILSLISWNTNYSNHEFYLKFVHKLKYGSLYTVRLSKQAKNLFNSSLIHNFKS